MSMNALAARVSGQDNLYAALSGVGAEAVGPLLAALQAGDAVAQETARRLKSVDAGLLRAVMRYGAGGRLFRAPRRCAQHLLLPRSRRCSCRRSGKARPSRC